MEETNITNFEIASSPEELQASMDREAQQEPQNPVQEAAQEQAPEPVQETPYVDPDAAPSEPQQEVLVREMEAYKNKVVMMVGYLVHIKHTSTSKGKRMYFGTWLDREGYFIDSTHFPPVAARYPFRGKGIYELTGKIVEEFDFLSIEVTSMRKLEYVHDPRYAEEPRHQRMGVNSGVEKSD